MAWIESHQSLRNHRKTLRMARYLSANAIEVIGSLHCLWWWALDSAPSGFIPSQDVAIIGEAASWPGPPDVYCQALIKAGFLDEVEGGYQLHDWPDYAGKLVDRRVRNAEQMRRARAAHKSITNETRVKHVLNTSDTRDDTCKATVPNPTVPYTSTNVDVSDEGSAPSGAVASATPARALWQAFLDVGWPEPATKSERGKWNAALRELLTAGVTVEEAKALASIYEERWPQLERSPNAIASNLSRLRDKPRPVAVAKPIVRPEDIRPEIPVYKPTTQEMAPPEVAASYVEEIRSRMAGLVKRQPTTRAGPRLVDIPDRETDPAVLERREREKERIRRLGHNNAG